MTKSRAPNLKSASGSGFSFEDKVTAFLFCEMLAGRCSLDTRWAQIDRIERQAGDWEPCGDLLLTGTAPDGKALRCFCSVKSNRPITEGGFTKKVTDAFWRVLAKPAFDPDGDYFGLFCSSLSKQVSPVLHQLCNQAREENRPQRLDEKITSKKHRRIYGSLVDRAASGEAGLPWHILVRLVPLEFDFEDVVADDEKAAIALCREILRPVDSTSETADELWKELLNFARDSRDAGGSNTRTGLTSKLRKKFRLRNDPLDLSTWTKLRESTREAMGLIDATLPGGLTLPRKREMAELRELLRSPQGFHVVGESGSGKSALVKRMVEGIAEASGFEIVWINSGDFGHLRASVPNLPSVLLGTRLPSGLLVFDALDGCYADDDLGSIGRTINELASAPDCPWKVVLVCQAGEWPRVLRSLVKPMRSHNALWKPFECGALHEEDMDTVYAHHPWVRRLSLETGLRHLLTSPKILDLLLRNQFVENRTLASEADLVAWWWEACVMGGKRVAAEEAVVRLLALRMADGLVNELGPDQIDAEADPLNALIKRRVLRRTPDKRFRFDHDLLADWSRVMYLRTFGTDILPIVREKVENPVWLRAIRILSQHRIERTSDLAGWRAVVRACQAGPNPGSKPNPEHLQILDVWLEGVVHCADSARVLGVIRADLFEHDGWLLRRLVRRLLHTATVPDAEAVERLRELDARSAASAELQFRLPQPFLWRPIVDLLLADPATATDAIPAEIAEIGEMWLRSDRYFDIKWAPLAELLLFNGEKELRREVSGEAPLDRGSTVSAGGRDSRTKIYRAALLAAPRFPDRVAVLALKAAGRHPWEPADISEAADCRWRGELRRGDHWRNGLIVKDPPESWPDGPMRRTSSDFRRALFVGHIASILYSVRPDAAVEASLAFLIDWPKATIVDDYLDTVLDNHGFARGIDEMLPAFWTNGPFLVFLRSNWEAALRMIIKLVDFATDRYEDWWPQRPGVSEVVFPVGDPNIRWKGTPQIYAWNHYNMKTAEAVTYALMALEKWLSERLEAGQSISEPVNILYRSGRSLAFAGVLISLGKRYPQEFLRDLKPLLFAHQFYVYDENATRNYFGDNIAPFGGLVPIQELRLAWARLPGRKTCLKDYCHAWLLTNEEMAKLLGEVAAFWRNQAEGLSTDPESRLFLLQWAADFDRSLWRQRRLPDGRLLWESQREPELRDDEKEIRGRNIQYLLTVPGKCAQYLAGQRNLPQAQLDHIWEELGKWSPYEEAAAGPAQMDHPAQAPICDHRHARSGLLAVLICSAPGWLSKEPSRRAQVEVEVRKLLADPPMVHALSDEDCDEDCEAFLARCVVHLWASNPENPGWRTAVGSFCTVVRYATVQLLFEEAFRVREMLGSAYRDLEALALSFAFARFEANRTMIAQHRREALEEVLAEWQTTWLPLFATGGGPEWIHDWSSIERLEEFHRIERPNFGMIYRCVEVHRRNYGFDMGVILSAYENLPALAQAAGRVEMEHWIHICQQMIGALCRTFPIEIDAETEELDSSVLPVDQRIFGIAARRVFECAPELRPTLWKPIMDLTPAAHRHITYFLESLLLETCRTDPPRIQQLGPLWLEIADYLKSAETRRPPHKEGDLETWKVLLLYGVPSHIHIDERFTPLVEELRPFFERHVTSLVNDADEQSSLAAFLITTAASGLFIEAFGWLRGSWESAPDHFWERAAERASFAGLLDTAWKFHFDGLRKSPDALAAFKILTLNLAVRNVRMAMEIQQRIGEGTSS